MQRVIWWLQLFLLGLGALPTSVHASAAGRPTGFMESMARLSAQQLTERGDSFLNRRNLPDSALACYTIAAARLHSFNADSPQLYWSTKALRQLGVLNRYYYLDFQQSNLCFLKAKEIAQRNNYLDLLAMLYLDMGNMYRTYGAYNGQKNYAR